MIRRVVSMLTGGLMTAAAEADAGHYAPKRSLMRRASWSRTAR